MKQIRDYDMHQKIFYQEENSKREQILRGRRVNQGYEKITPLKNVLTRFYQKGFQNAKEKKRRVATISNMAVPQKWPLKKLKQLLLKTEVESEFMYIFYAMQTLCLKGLLPLS